MNIKNNVSNIRVFFLYALFFTMPFEYWSEAYFFGVTPARYIGLSYFMLALLSFNKSFSINSYTKIVIIPALLWLWFIFIELINISRFEFTLSFHFQFFYLWIFFWLITNELRKDPNVRWGILLAFILSMLVVAIFISLGYGIQVNSSGDASESLDGVSRVWLFGMNPNTLGNYAAYSILFSVFLYYEYFESAFKKALILSVIPVLFVLLAYSGSSGAFIALLFGLILYFLLKKSSFLNRLKYTLYGILIVGVMFYFLADFKYLHNKMTLFFEEGGTSGRTEIWYFALEIISNNPIFGLGRNGAEQTLVSLHGRHFTAHNVYLDVFMWGGIFALFLYLLFFLLVFLRSFKSFQYTGFASSMVIVIVLAFLMVKSGGGFTLKVFWFFMPLAIWYPMTLNNKLKKRFGGKSGVNQTLPKYWSV